jgi:hypothetical protein
VPGGLLLGKDIMNIRLIIFLLSADICLLLAGCQQRIPSDSFQLSVRDIVSDSDIRVSLITIHISRATRISVYGDGFSESSAIQEKQNGSVADGEVLMCASRITTSENKAYIQTLIRTRTGDGDYAGGPAVYPVSPDVKLDEFFKISASNGIFKFDTPITIAQLQGKPVTLVVGKPTK